MYEFLKRKLGINIFHLPSILVGGMSALTTENSPDYTSETENHGGVSSANHANMPATRELVEQLIASDTVVIFSKSQCPYCKMAKKVFDSLQKKYTAIELNEREDGDDIQTILGEMTGARTVPRVFVKGECLGGGTDVKQLYDSGELQLKF